MTSAALVLAAAAAAVSNAQRCSIWMKKQQQQQQQLYARRYVHLYRPRTTSTSTSTSTTRTRPLEAMKRKEWNYNGWSRQGDAVVVVAAAVGSTLASSSACSGSGSGFDSNTMLSSSASLLLALGAATTWISNFNKEQFTFLQANEAEMEPDVMATSGMFLETGLAYCRPTAATTTTTTTTTTTAHHESFSLPLHPHQHHRQETNNSKNNKRQEQQQQQALTLSATTDPNPNPVVLSMGHNVHSKYYDLSIRAVKGKRLSMEDTYFVAPGGRFAAVFDGHGGASVSTYLRDHLYTLAKQALKEKQWEMDDTLMDDMPSSESDNDTDVTADADADSDSSSDQGSIASHVAAIRSAFTQAEEHVLQQPNMERQGSTAVAVWIHESPATKTRTLISANVGDSRAILSRQGEAIDLTRDHKPNEEREKSRIRRLGGTIEWDALAKVHRVQSLSLSRAIGDSFAKPIVSSQVEVKLFPVLEGKDDFLLLASDGLWDVMTSQEVVTYVKNRFQTELAKRTLADDKDIENCKLVLRRNMARSLCREALRRGSGDNICVLMIWLNDGANFTDTSSPATLSSSSSNY